MVNHSEKVLRSFLVELFEGGKFNVLRYSFKQLVTLLNERQLDADSLSVDEIDLKGILKAAGLKAERKSIWYKTPVGLWNKSIVWYGGVGRPFTFRAEIWGPKK